MKKLRLDLEHLQVETFDTAAEHGAEGTVVARQDGTAMTVCWGLCGGESEGVFGCGGGSEGCTLDPYNDNCYSYAQQCPFTVIPSWSCAGTCGAEAGETVCAGNCTHQCTV